MLVGVLRVKSLKPHAYFTWHGLLIVASSLGKTQSRTQRFLLVFQWRRALNHHIHDATDEGRGMERI